MGTLFLAVLVTMATPPVRPAGAEVAVFAFQARNGVPTDVAAIVTDHVVDVLRRTPGLRRVASWPELQALLSLEQAKQLVDCSEESCITEVMGALNVEYVVMGSVGRLGRHLVLNLQMLKVRTSMAVASISMRVCADDEGLILTALEHAVRNMLVEARVMGGRTVPVPPHVSECLENPAAGAAPPPSPRESGFRRRVTLAGAGAGALVATAGLVVGLSGWALAVASLAYLYALQTPKYLEQVQTPGLTRTPRLLVLYGVEVGGGVASVVAISGGLVALAAGLTALVVLFIFGS
jgi:TolB-like protein